MNCWCSHANSTDKQGTDENLTWALCYMEQQSRWNSTINATNDQPADKTSRIKHVHLSALLALNPGPIDKNNSKEVLPQPVRQKMVAHMRTFPITAPAQEAISAAASTVQQAPGDTAMPSMASSPASALSTPSVEFTETNPEALRGLGLGIDAIEQEAPVDTVMNDTESEGEGEEISTGGNFALFMAQVCLSFFLKFKNT